jgi:2',3'-cyclic-nucleotide 2'-phosphodiesterase (5'-nucleotidase family)
MKIKKISILMSGITVALLFSLCRNPESIPTAPPVDPDSTRCITILYTNDEHGWMEVSQYSDGAAGMMGLWREKEGYSEEGPFLILSGGDMWTGPAISTWFQGESMIEVMNTMNYDAAAIGNHEFDFKIDVLQQRISEANFPLLSANIRHKGTDEIPDFAIPYLIIEVNGIKVGLIGLTTTTTPISTFPEHVADLDFISYETALQEIVPEVKSNDAELLIVLAHIPEYEMRTLAPFVSSMGIPLLLGGHGHELVNDRIGSTTILEAGSYMRYYGKVKINFNTELDSVITIESGIYDNLDTAPDPAVEAVVSYWRTMTDNELSQVIGYADQTIDQRSDLMFNMVTDSWLWAIPSADISLTNKGGIRQYIPSGDITLSTIVGVLPFDNDIVELDLTGSQLINSIGYLVVGGMTTIGEYRLSDGTPIFQDSVYQVLTTDYLYSRTDYPFQEYDPVPYNTSINYRQPVIDWIKSMNTSQSNPLNPYLDPVSRQ